MKEVLAQISTRGKGVEQALTLEIKSLLKQDSKYCSRITKGTGNGKATCIRYYKRKLTALPSWVG